MKKCFPLLLSLLISSTVFAQSPPENLPNTAQSPPAIEERTIAITGTVIDQETG